ncbi:MAG: YbaK/prolyl-tRNA synthetase-like protein [Monoraphidium minutum]|nr:MAG: YbaK/prolyl-tRNA synthetase-like protein [Monoraphidium minutum]
MAEDRVSALMQRLEALQLRVSAAESAQQLVARFAALEARIAAAQEASQPDTDAAAAAPAAAAPPSAPAPAAAARAAACAAALEAALSGDDSAVQHRLARELAEKGVPGFRFVRVPPDYYERPLAWRQGVLGAASVHHLCKSIIMENTRAHPSVKGWEDPHNSKYYCVVVQYTARFNNEKLCAHLHKLNGGKVGKKWFNLRLCPEDVSDSLSGFGHNGVSPVGLAARVPIILSHRITQLTPDFFFMGGGEVDLKLGLSAADFAAAYAGQPLMVADCTYDDEGAGDGGEEEPPCG